MKIKMRTTASGPSYNYVAGNTYDVQQAIAMALVEAGAAEALEKPRGRPPKAPVVVETATAPGANETAEVTPKRKPRKRKAR